MYPRPEPRDVPALLRPDETRETWIASRRAELRDLLERQCYGLRPVERPPQLSFAQIPHDPRSLEEDNAPVLGGAAFRRRASPAWELFGRRGLVGTAFPAPDAPPLQEGWISYHLRAGSHALTERDWAAYLDFADKRMA